MPRITTILEKLQKEGFDYATIKTLSGSTYDVVLKKNIFKNDKSIVPTQFSEDNGFISGTFGRLSFHGVSHPSYTIPAPENPHDWYEVTCAEYLFIQTSLIEKIAPHKIKQDLK